MYDHLIVGQGLAGSILALTLLRRGHKVLVISRPGLSVSSEVAAGLVNPLVFKRFTKAWNVDAFIPFLEDFYAGMDTITPGPVYRRMPMLKPYGNEDEKKLWQQAIENNNLQEYVSNADRHLDHPGVINPHGCLEIQHSGRLDTNLFLESIRIYLQQQDAYLEEDFIHNRLQINDQGVSYEGRRAADVIFCEGFLAAEHNPWFSGLPFRLTKGEVLDVEIAGFHSSYILNRGVFLLPLENDRFKLGATYRWHDTSQQPTAGAAAELLEKASVWCSTDIQVLGQKAGIRPTVADRRPLIGMHPAYPQLGIFNGMGSKAVMYAPLLADHFALYLEDRSRQLMPEVNISRFGKHMKLPASNRS